MNYMLVLFVLGMIVINEFGIYKIGCYGVCMENIMLIVLL